MSGTTPPSPPPAEPETPGPTRTAGRRGRWLLLALASSVALVGAEAALRIYSPEIGTLRRLVRSTDDDRGFAPRPHASLRFDGVFERLSRPVLWQTDAWGMRSEREVPRESDRFRVAAFGDSETFGWSLPLEDTFPRRMEALDPRVEVLNFGVPGYNVTNVRAHLECAVPEFSPDLVLYLVNKNDFNEAVHLTPLSYSDLLLRLRFLWHFTIGKEIRLMIRGTPERLATFADEVDRMTRFLETRDVPFLLGFLRWSNHEAVREYVPSAASRQVSDAGGRFRRELLNVREVVRGKPKADTHYAAAAHRAMAELFCRVIAGGDSGACVPPDFRQRRAGAEGSAVTHLH